MPAPGLGLPQGPHHSLTLGTRLTAKRDEEGEPSRTTRLAAGSPFLSRSGGLLSECVAMATPCTVQGRAGATLRFQPGCKGKTPATAPLSQQLLRFGLPPSRAVRTVVAPGWPRCCPEPSAGRSRLAGTRTWARTTMTYHLHPTRVLRASQHVVASEPVLCLCFYLLSCFQLHTLSAVFLDFNQKEVINFIGLSKEPDFGLISHFL